MWAVEREGESLCGKQWGGRCFLSDCSGRESINEGWGSPNMSSHVILILIGTQARIRPYSLLIIRECNKTSPTRQRHYHTDQDQCGPGDTLKSQVISCLTAVLVKEERYSLQNIEWVKMHSSIPVMISNIISWSQIPG